MADRAAEDSTPRAKVSVPAAPPRFIDAILRKHYGEDADLPTPWTWAYAESACVGYSLAVWAASSEKKHTQALRKYKWEQERLNTAARILQADLENLSQKVSGLRGFPAAAALWQADLDKLSGAIVVLKRARAWDHPEVRAVERLGPAMKGWTHFALEIARWLVGPLRCSELPISTRKTSPFIKTIRDLLVLIYGEEKAPSCSGLSKALDKYKEII